MCKVKTLFTLRSTMTPNKERVACSPNASPVQIVLSAKIIANDKKAKDAENETMIQHAVWKP